MNFRSTILASFTLFGLVTVAHAAPLAVGSQISLSGYVQSINSVSLTASTALDFVAGPMGSSSVGRAGTLTSYGAGTGSFAGITCASGGCGSIQDVLNLATGAQNIANFLSLAGGNNISSVNFNLTGITEIDRLPSGFLNFVATGAIDYGNFDSTAGTFTFSAQGDQIVSFFGTVLASSSSPGGSVTTVTIPPPGAVPVSPAGTNVPEPASLALLGGALIGLGILRRK